MFKRCDKRAQGLSTNAIILIVLGVFILAIMILGFTIGWAKLVPFLSVENVDSVVNGCEVACTTGSQFGYCSKPMALNDGTVEIKDKTCNDFATDVNYVKYGIKTCSTITCSTETPAQ